MNFRDFRGRHPSFVATFAIILLAAIAIDGWLLYKNVRYRREIDRLHSGMSDVERRHADAIVSSDQKRWRMMVELVRRQARGARDIHLAVEVDSGLIYLEREGAVLREFPAAIGPEARVGTPPDTIHMAVPRGARTVQRILGKTDAWEVPAWVYTDRGLPVPPDRSLAGALGPAAIVLEGGTVIYSAPTAGPLNDSAYVLPGGVRAEIEDLKAILPNLKRGMTVYFY